MSNEWITLHADGSDMGAYVSRPENPNGAAMMIIQEAFGVNHHIQDVTERFAREGYLAISPELYHRTAPHQFTSAYGDMAAIAPHAKAVTAGAMTADIIATYDWLKTQNVNTIGSIGFCMGGRASFLANATVDLAAAVSFYGGGIAQQMIDRAADQRSPILLFWGGLDKHILPEHNQAVTAALREAGKDFINIEISKADHGFFCNERAQYNPEAAREAWVITKEFLATNLRVGK